tara:strand:- start:474 stop:602 length:129 start_codon:yes stop_codon:yes gene_type:complete
MIHNILGLIGKKSTTFQNILGTDFLDGKYTVVNFKQLQVHNF